MQIVKNTSLSDGFTIIDARLTSFTFHIKLSSDSLDIDLKMQLTHTADHHFLSLFVDVDAEGRVLSFELRKSLF